MVLFFYPAFSFGERKPEKAAPAWPTKPINLIVPWNPGGASDLTARILAVEMEKVLKQRISVTNMPGASGAIGTQAVYDAPHDGYTWCGNAEGNTSTYEYLGDHKFSPKTWDCYWAVFTPNVVCVAANSPINDFGALLNTMKSKVITIGSAGVGSGGHRAAEVLRKYANVEYKHISYKGGAPAITGVIQGEVEAVMQLSMEVAEMLRAKQLKALAVTDREPLELAGYGSIPPITNWIKDFPSLASKFGIYLPKDTPPFVRDKVKEAFLTAARSPALKEFANSRGAKVITEYGKEADKSMDLAISLNSWLLFEAGTGKRSPAELGIPKP